jgi:error-prone DNA polymerase
MGFYHPSTLVKDAQRRGVRFHPIDVQASDWDCIVEPDGAVRLGLRYVAGLREQSGRAIASVPRTRHPAPGTAPSTRHPAPGTAPGTQHPAPGTAPSTQHPAPGTRFVSLPSLISTAALRRDEVVTLADIGALNAFGYDRRSALWQAEHAVRPGGELFDAAEAAEADETPSAPPCPLPPMTEAERIVADYAGMGLTVGRHPMALRRDELAARGVLRAADLRQARHGRRGRVAGMVMTRQRPGTAKGFVFLTLEDETGVANVIVRPDLFARDRLTIVDEPFLLVHGVLQHQDGVVSIRAEQVAGLGRTGSLGALDFDAHDFY